MDFAIEVDLALFAKLHDCDHGDNLGDRADVMHAGAVLRRAAFEVRQANSTRKNDFAIDGNSRGNPGHAAGMQAIKNREDLVGVTGKRGHRGH